MDKMVCGLTVAGTREIIKESGHQYRWLAGGYDLEIGHFRSGYHGGYLVHRGFFCTVLVNAIHCRIVFMYWFVNQNLN